MTTHAAAPNNASPTASDARGVSNSSARARIPRASNFCGRVDLIAQECRTASDAAPSTSRDLPAGTWIIDETVEAINRAAEELVEAGERYGALRRKFFLPVRPLSHYVDALARAGLRVRQVEHIPVEESVADWTAFLATYHDGVLGWVGGSERVEGEPPTREAIADRLELLRESVARVFEGPSFHAVWTYIDAE